MILTAPLVGKSQQNSKCACCPKNHQRLRRRLRHVNTVICEQTFSWFRGYARSFLTMRAARHHFAVLAFSRWHNQLVDAGDLDHLNAFSANKRARSSKPYTCNK